MALMELTPDLLVGNAFIDGDHRKLVKLINDFHDAMAQGKGNDVIGKVLNALVDYTKEHFAREEAEMARIGYIASIAHKREHTKLIADVDKFHADFMSSRPLMTMPVSKFLKDWLITHINQTDKLFAKALNSAK